MRHVLFFLSIICIQALHAQSIDLTQWSLVLDDEFNTDSSFNTIYPSAKWLTGYQWEGSQCHGEEPEYYTRYNKAFSTTCSKGGVNHFINEGVLSLQARKEPDNNYQVFSFPNGVATTSCKRYDYTSGLLFSKKTFTYGYFEISCKIPNQGTILWPAFWLYSGDAIPGANPSYGTYREIDVFEFTGSKPNIMGANIHMTEGLITGNWSELSAANSVTNMPYDEDLGNTDITNQFHTYAVKWTESSIVWYFDGMEVRTESQQVPHWPMYVIANLALSPYIDIANTDAVLPVNLEIDYIRIYQLKSDEPARK